MSSPALVSGQTRKASNTCMDWQDSLFQDPDSRLHEPQIIPYDAPICHAHSATASASSSSSACSLTALNFVRQVWKLEAEGTTGAELLRRVVSQAMIDDVMKISTALTTDIYLDLGNSLGIPIFEETLKVDWGVALGRSPDIDNGLESLLSAWFSSRNIVLSLSGQVLLFLRIPAMDSASDVYALFDCHSRADHAHAHGPAFILSKRLDDITAMVCTIFSEGDANTLSGNASQGHTLSALCMSPHPNGHRLEVRELLPKSVAYISKCSPSAVFLAPGHVASPRVQAENKKRHSKSGAELTHFEEKYELDSTHMPSDLSPSVKSVLDRSRSVHRRSDFAWQLALQQPISSSDSASKSANSQSTSADNKENLFLPLPTESLPRQMKKCATIEGSNDHPKEPTVETAEDNLRYDGSPSLNAKDQKQAGTKPQSVKEDKKKNWAVDSPTLPHNELHTQTDTIPEPLASTSATHDPDSSWDAALAHQLQEEENLSVFAHRHRSWDNTWLIALQKKIEEDILAASSTDAGANMDWQLAVQLQQDAGPSRSASSEGNDNSSSSTFTTIRLPSDSESFECSVCTEIHNVSVKINLSECGHMFCKDCLSKYTKTKIEDNRYPIFCPECIIENPGSIKPQLGEETIQQLDLPEGTLMRLQELQLVLHCITLQCPRCKEVMNVDRGQFSEQSVLICPLPRCGHKWCKGCLKTLPSSQHHHRCKNSNIDRLMKRKGWKYCPGCRTPVQKETGCNHMTCGTPGCNVHFCYKCGVLMVDTTHGGDVGTAVTEHYMDCQLFEKRWKCTIQ